MASTIWVISPTTWPPETLTIQAIGFCFDLAQSYRICFRRFDRSSSSLPRASARYLNHRRAVRETQSWVPSSPPPGPLHLTCLSAALAFTSLHPPHLFLFHIAPMPTIFSISHHDDSFHHVAGDTYSPLRTLEDACNRYLHTKTPKPRSPGQYNDVDRDERGAADGEILTNFKRSTERLLTDHPLSARPKLPSIISTLPPYFQRWLENIDSDDEEDLHPPPTIDQDSMDNGTDGGHPLPQRGHDFTTESHYVSQALYAPVTVGKLVDPDELFGEAAMTFASEYLNLDYETSTFASQTVDAGSSSPSTSYDSSTGPTSTVGDAETQWEVEPTSLSLLDATKFETEVDANGVETRNPWPWGDYTYYPPSPPRQFDLDDYAQEFEFSRIEEKLRIRLMERFAEEAIHGSKKVKTERRRGKKKSRGVGKKTSAPVIVAFSREVRGRTIYNP